MSYPYSTHRIHEILKAEKRLLEGDADESKKVGKSGLYETRPELIDGPFVDMRYIAKAPVLTEVTTCEASFLLANQRVRGVGYHSVGRWNFRFKQRIPKGWHLNVCDPNLPTNDPKQNIHQPLPEFTTTDFKDFIRKTTKLWKIDLGRTQEGELFS
ncbi:MAG: hypothetical protein OXE51_09110 [Gammaproteobacteria bacterium]|nr:hypothetical protein [Gammaproteobacteria bacterium]